MRMTSHVDTGGQSMTIRVEGPVDARDSYEVLEHAVVSGFTKEYHELVLDLRQAWFDESCSLFRQHTLVRIFHALILEKSMRITVLFGLKQDEQRIDLHKSDESSWVTLRYSATHKAAAWLSVGPLSASAATP
ncbi:MAG: hypothetical protein ACOX5Z_05500 [Desulfobulbus sp.]|jgi:hypothetical protein